MTTEVFQIAPGTVLVQGYEISGDDVGWKGLRWTHKRVRVVDDPVRGLHLKVPFKYLGNTRNPVRFWRVYPRAKVGRVARKARSASFHSRGIGSVAPVADPGDVRHAKRGDRVVLTEEARSRFPDIGTRAGTVLAVDGWVIVQFDKHDWQTRLPAHDLERISP